MIDQPAIVESAPPAYFWIARGPTGKRIFIWCGQFVDEAAYYANFAEFIRSGKRSRCPKGRYPYAAR